MKPEDIPPTSNPTTGDTQPPVGKGGGIEINARGNDQIAVASGSGTATNQNAQTIINLYTNASSEGQTVASSRQLNLLGQDPIGRDEFTSKVVGKVLGERKRVVEVYGEPGIGKTTVCLHIVRELKNKYDKVYTVDFTDIREKEAVIAEMLMVLGIKPGESNALEGQLVYAANEQTNTLFYMDNMEDAMKSDSFKDWFIRFINAVGWTIVFSSRERFNNHMIYSEALDVLSPEHALTLFTKHWQNNRRQILPSDEPILKDLLKDMGHHPLSVVLVANQWRYQSVKDLSNAWHKDQFDDNISVDGAGRHKNLLKALSFSYESVSEDKRAIEIWAVMRFVPTQISNEMFYTTFGDSAEEYRDAAALLIKNSLLRGDKNGFSMLNPIKGFIFTRDNEGKVCDRAVDRFFDSLTMFYKNANNFGKSDREKWHNLAIDALPIAIELLSKRESHSKAETLTNEMHNHWKYNAFESLVFLQGYLPRIKTPIVRANVLWSMGDLESRLGEVEAAQGHYAEAEKLYLSEKDNLGRANALKSMGDLEREHGEIDKSIPLYIKALDLYKLVQEPMGYTYTIAELCRAYAMVGKPQDALTYLDLLKTAINGQPDVVKSYLIDCGKEAIGLLSIPTSHEITYNFPIPGKTL
ncbi:MAG: tetratricopeptide repeat protein [Oscillospiraceae bacterium]|nr:tetratricopeptide repeat protein [Oscillospiraceae bacterium]